MEWQSVVTAAEYIKFRQQTRSFGVTLKEFNEHYPARVLINEWRDMLPEMFRTSEKVARVSVIRSIEHHCDSAEIFLGQMNKFYPEKLPAKWWEYLESWREAQNAKRNT